MQRLGDLRNDIRYLCKEMCPPYCFQVNETSFSDEITEQKQDGTGMHT